MQPLKGFFPGGTSGDDCEKLTIRVHQVHRMCVELHPMDKDATAVLGPSQEGPGGVDDPDRFPASGSTVYLSEPNILFPDTGSEITG